MQEGTAEDYFGIPSRDAVPGEIKFHKVLFFHSMNLII